MEDPAVCFGYFPSYKPPQCWLGLCGFFEWHPMLEQTGCAANSNSLVALLMAEFKAGAGRAKNQPLLFHPKHLPLSAWMRFPGLSLGTSMVLCSVGSREAEVTSN